MQKINYNDLTPSQLKTLIQNKESFVLLGIRGNIKESIKKIETEIESQNLKCRINSDFKAGVTAAGGLGVVGALLAAPTAAVVGGIIAGQAMHTVLTLNPDYIVTKDYVNAKLTIEYKKKK